MQTVTTCNGNALARDVVAGVVARNEHILLPAETSCAWLDALAVRLALLRCRVLRPSMLDVLTLPGLLAQIVGRACSETLEESDLERGLELLTTTGPDDDRVVLLLDRADVLDPAALRYIQSLIQDAPLQLLFVGGPGLFGSLTEQDFGALRRGFVAYAAELLPTADTPSLSQLPVAMPSPIPCGCKPPRSSRWPLTIVFPAAPHP